MIATRKDKKTLRRKFYVILACVLIIFLSVSVGREWYRNYLVRKEIKQLEDEAAQLESRKLELLDLSRRFESGEFVERAARLELGLQKPGETVVVIQNQANKGELSSDDKEKTNPELWLNYFLHRSPDS